MHGLLLVEVNVSFKPFHRFGVRNWLGESTRNREWIRPSWRRAVEVFSFKSFSINGDRSGILVLPLRNALFEFFVSVLLGASVHACLYNKLLVALFHRNFSAILGLHYLLTNNIRGQVFLGVGVTAHCVKVSLRKLLFFLFFLLFKFFLYLSLDLFLKHMGLATDSGNTVSRVLACPPDTRGRVSGRVLNLAVDTVSCVVELLVGVYLIFKVKMALRNVLLHDCSKNRLYWNCRKSSNVPPSVLVNGKANFMPNSAYLPSPENSFSALSSCQLATKVPFRVVVCLL